MNKFFEIIVHLIELAALAYSVAVYIGGDHEGAIFIMLLIIYININNTKGDK